MSLPLQVSTQSLFEDSSGALSNRGIAEPELSIVIPAYNEEKRIGRTLECIRARFTEGFSGLDLNDIEVLVVDDGSVDGTAQVVENYAKEMTSLRLVSNGKNRGKGYSVRHGMLEAKGRLALFMDADLSFSMDEAEKLLSILAAGNDVAIGSRSIVPSLMEMPPPAMRKLAGAVFNNLLRFVLVCRSAIHNAVSKHSFAQTAGPLSNNSEWSASVSIRKFCFSRGSKACGLPKFRCGAPMTRRLRFA